MTTADQTYRSTRKMMTAFIDRIEARIWRVRLNELPGYQAFIIRQIRIMVLAFRGVREDNCMLHASALTFYTLLSIGPAAALALGIAKGFGFQRVVETQLYERFPGQDEVLAQIIEYAYNFLDTAKGGVIAGVGVVFLFWSVLKVLHHIENSFNVIWRIEQPRSLERKITNYLAFMLIMPVLLIMSSSIPAFVSAHLTQVVQKLPLSGAVTWIVPLLLKLVPYALMLGLFSLIYLLIPNTRVKISSGIYAGIVASIIYIVVQWAYIRFQIGISRYNTIYGSLAALPLLLIWLQLSWVIVLTGTEVSFAHQHVKDSEYDPEQHHITPYTKKLLTLLTAQRLVRQFADGEPPLTAREISGELEIPVRLTYEILSDLQHSGLVSNTKIDEDEPPAFQPASDINRWTIRFVLDRLDRPHASDIHPTESATLKSLSENLQQLSKSMADSPANKLLKDL